MRNAVVSKNVAGISYTNSCQILTDWNNLCIYQYDTLCVVTTKV